MGIKENVHEALENQLIVFADFEMICRAKRHNKPTSIVSAGLVFTNNKQPLHINVAPESDTPWRFINDTAKFLGVSKKEVLSGISFTNLYKQLLQQVGDGVLVVWGDYDNITLAAQCKRAGIKHTLKVFDLQEAIIQYLKTDIHLSRMLQDSSFRLPLAKIHKILLNKEMKNNHHPVQDAVALKKIYAALTTDDKMKNKATEIALMRLMQTHTMEAFERYMNNRLNTMAKNVAYQMHGTVPEKSAKTAYTPTFNTLNEVMLELEQRVQVIEANQRARYFSLDEEEEYIDLSEFGPVDIHGDPVGW